MKLSTPRRAITVCLLVAVIIAPAAARKKKTGIPLTKRADQVAEIKDAALLTLSAAEPCRNYAWAAVLEKLLAAQQVKMPQRALVAKSSYGERCLNDPVNLPAISGYVTGDYVLDSGRKVHIAVTYLEGPPDYIDPMLAAIQANRPLLMVYKGRPMLLYGVLFDEFVAPNGSRIFRPRELRMNDPIASVKEQHTVFTVGKDDAGEIGGLLSVDVKDRAF